jgi:hypothetical protein
VVDDGSKASNVAAVTSFSHNVQRTAARIISATLQVRRQRQHATTDSDARLQQSRGTDKSIPGARKLLHSPHNQSQHTTSAEPTYTFENTTLWCAPTRQHADETISVAEALSVAVESANCPSARHLPSSSPISLARAQAVLSACKHQQGAEIVTHASSTVSREPSTGWSFQNFAHLKQAVVVNGAAGSRRLFATLTPPRHGRLGRRGVPEGTVVGLPAVFGVLAVIISCIGAHFIILPTVSNIVPGSS